VVDRKKKDVLCDRSLAQFYLVQQQQTKKLPEIKKARKCRQKYNSNDFRMKTTTNQFMMCNNSLVVKQNTVGDFGARVRKELNTANHFKGTTPHFMGQLLYGGNLVPSRQNLVEMHQQQLVLLVCERAVCAEWPSRFVQIRIAAKCTDVLLAACAANANARAANTGYAVNESDVIV
jgi:hypothetical protein